MNSRNRRITLTELQWENIVYILNSYEAYDYADMIERQLRHKKSPLTEEEEE